jgi:hypothetical protein
MQKLAGIKEISINKPGVAQKFNSNRDLYEFLNRHIKAFAERELNRRRIGYQIISDFIDQIEDTDEFTEIEIDELSKVDTINELPQKLQLKVKDRLVDMLVKVGLEYYDDEITWNLPELGLIYSNTGESDPGSYEWDEEKFKNREFYSLSFDI